MREEKFVKDMHTLYKFVGLYCKEKHDCKKSKKDLILHYRGKSVDKISYELCLECEENFLYSYQRLQECPHEEKSRCRHCKKPCYEKTKWKSLAKIMKYSGIRLGLTKIKKIFKINKGKL